MVSSAGAVVENNTQKTSDFATRFKEMMESDPQLKAMKPDPSVAEALENNELSLERTIDFVLEAYSDRPALGTREYKLVCDAKSGRCAREYLPAYRTISYGEYRSQIRSVASAWSQGQKQSAVGRDDFVCIIGFASTQFAVIDTACFYVQAIPVPLQSSTSGADIDEIFANTHPKLVAATIDDVVMAAEHVVTHGNVPTLMVFDYEPRDDNDKEKLQRAKEVLLEADVNTQLLSFDEVVSAGEGFQWEFPEPHPEDELNHTSLIIHSSGSTGKPKGALMNEAGQKSFWNSTLDKNPIVTVLFAPLNHGMGRSALCSALRRGSTAYFTLKPDMSSLFEDIRLVRPTYLSIFPRVFELIYQHYQNEVARLVREGVDEAEAQSTVKEEMGSTFLGDRLMLGTVGSAPTSEVIKNFVVECFDINLIEAYGNTEMGGGAVTRNNVIQRPNVVAYKLVDVPELGYFGTDKPYPRGELCFKTRYQIKGYLNDPEATAGLIDDEGFICSGDIVEEWGEDHVVIVDRRKDVLKLSQGEYVAVGTLGTVFESGSPLIKQIYVYGNSNRAYLLAVVVPEEKVIQTSLGNEYEDTDLHNLVRGEIQRVAQEAELKSFEVPRDFIVEMDPFSQENGLLSSVRKRLRPALKAKYQGALEAIYENHANRSQREYELLKENSEGLQTPARVLKLLEITLGVEGLDGSVPRTFKELGGDSLGAVEFSISIENIFGVSLPADSILSPTGCIANWADEIDALLHPSNYRPSMNSIHGEGADRLRAADLKLERFFPEAEYRAMREVGPLSQGEDCILLTGANGFLGRHVCLQWMEKLAPVDGKVVCLIRARDDAAARARLDEVFAGSDPDLERHYQRLASQHLEVFAGDAGAEFLGLGAQKFAELAASVDRVVHVAALVNHRLAYEHLFGPNVVGTAELIKFCATHHKKPIDFVSTEAVLGLVDPAFDGSNEDAPLLREVPLLNDRYASGYAASKWAGELLLQDAREALDIPVNVLRGGMMLAHSRYRGQINLTDTFSRLLYSIVITGVAPPSFFAEADDGTHPSENYDGLPVDTVAAAVVAAANLRGKDCGTFNIHNYHRDDGGTLDAFVSWIESAGYSISRLASHAEWMTRFEEKLKSLPDDQRQRSALDTLAAYSLRRAGGGSIYPDSDNFERLVASFDGVESLPHLDEAFIHKCLDDIAVEYGF